jgi:hypothetical protein
MQLNVLTAKSQEMGDYYVYHLKDDGKTVSFFVGTSDLSTPYIQEQIKKQTRGQPIRGLPDTHVYMWSWTHNSLRQVELKSIKKLVPLSSVLKNVQ